MNFHKDNCPAVTSDQISSFEEYLQLELPPDYRTFLLMHNGGVPEQARLYVEDVNDHVLIDHFFGIGVTHYDIVDWVVEMEDDLPSGFIPIAFDPGANVFLMNISDGCVFYWDSARHFSCSTDEENTYEVASSFTALIEKMVSD